MSDSPVPGHMVTLADIYNQGVETAERVGRLETTVSQLARVDERLDSHSGRLREAEKILVEQATDAEDIAALTKVVTVQGEDLTKLKEQLARVLWVPTVALTVMSGVGIAVIMRSINGG